MAKSKGGYLGKSETNTETNKKIVGIEKGKLIGK